MAKVRTGRVGEQLKKELSYIFLSELKDPAIGFLTVTGVDMTSDLSQAKVYISVLGNEEQQNATLKALARSKGFIRTELGKRIRLRHVPDLLFLIDHSIAYGSRIEKLFDSIHGEEDK